MDLNNILFWLSAGTSLIFFFQAIQVKAVRNKRWIFTLAGILSVSGITYVFWHKYCGFISGGLSFVFIILPILCYRLEIKLSRNKNFPDLIRLRRLFRWLYPYQAWPLEEAILKANVSMSNGNLEEAVATLEQLEINDPDSVLYRNWYILYLKRNWAHIITLFENEASDIHRKKDVELIMQYIRAKGEVGDLNGMLDTMDKYHGILEHNINQYHFFILMAAAFCGHGDFVMQLFSRKKFMPTIDPNTRTMWLAVSAYASGNIETGFDIIKPYLKSNDCFLRLNAEKYASGGIIIASHILTKHSQDLLARFETDWLVRDHLFSNPN